MKNILLSLFLLVFLLCSCENDESMTKEENTAAIEAFLTQNNMTAQSTASGLFYIVEQVGDGNFPPANSTVTVTYKGYDLDENVFDESLNPISFPLQNLIEGWKEGIPLFSKGGSGTLLVPSHLAYGASSPSFNKPIIFEISLLDFQ